MTIHRGISGAVAILVTLALLGGCSSDAPDSPPVTVGSGGDRAAFTPQQQEVVDAVDDYYAAFFGRGTKGVTSAVEGRITDDLASQLVPAEKKSVDDADLEYIGTVSIEPRGVTISGDSAEFTGCQDGSDAFVVPAGDTRPGVGSRPVSSFDLTIALVRDGDQWLLDQPNGEKVSSC